MKENRSKLDAECLITPFLLLLAFSAICSLFLPPGCSVTFRTSSHMSLGSNKDYCKIKSKWRHRVKQRENEGNRKPKQRLRYVWIVCVVGMRSRKREGERFELAQWSCSNSTALFYFCLFSLARPTGFSHRAATIHTVLPHLYMCARACARARKCVHVCVYVHDFDLSLRRCGFHWNCREKKRKGRKGTERKKDGKKDRKKVRQKERNLTTTLTTHINLSFTDKDVISDILDFLT